MYIPSTPATDEEELGQWETLLPPHQDERMSTNGLEKTQQPLRQITNEEQTRKSKRPKKKAFFWLR